MAPFLMTTLLLDLLKKSSPSRIINLSSEAQRNGHIAFEDLGGAQSYSAMRAYTQAKLANILFTRELSQRFGKAGIMAVAIHPGVVNTGFGSEGPSWMRWMIPLFRPFIRTVEKGAETVIWAASTEDAQSLNGLYLSDKKPLTPIQEGQDDTVARKLWEVSEKLIAAQ
jgi:NAD(P)-dependent dehydrogenase (short-subunit alcohol dehydrogenase family)